MDHFNQKGSPDTQPSPALQAELDKLKALGEWQEGQPLPPLGPDGLSLPNPRTLPELLHDGDGVKE